MDQPGTNGRGATYMMGFLQSCQIVGDEPDKVRQKFQNFIKKLDSAHSNTTSSRLKAVKEIDQFIQKKNQKLQKALKERSYSVASNASTLNSSMAAQQLASKKYEFPYCLSIVILKIQDLVFKPDIKKENKIDLDTLVVRCLMHQRCLIYKIPNFILQFMDQFQEPGTKLNYLSFVTSDGQEMDTSFNSQLYIILLKMIDTSLKPPISAVLSFIHNIFQNHPSTFSETQTMQLLLRISLVGVISLERKQSDISQEVFQILQFFLKYNDYSPQLLNICLLTMCILCNRDPLTFPVLQVLSNLIVEKDAYIFQEIIGILQIQGNMAFWEKGNIQAPGSTQQKTVQDQQNYSLALRKEIQFKCFKGETFDSALELNDLQTSFALGSANREKDADRTFMRKTSLSELTCNNECPCKTFDLNQPEEILLLDKRASKAMIKDIHKFIALLEQDRSLWIAFFEKNIDRVYKGAVFFLGKVLWGSDRMNENYYYPINQVLKFFNQLINKKTKFNVLNEVLTTIKQLILRTDIPKYYEWEQILLMLETTAYHHIEAMMEKRKVGLVSDIFKEIKQLLLCSQFPNHLIGKALSVYLKYKNARAFTDKTLTQLMINHMLNYDFMNTFESLLDSCLMREKSVEIRTLFLDMVQDFYAETVDQEIYSILEAIFLNNLEQFYLTRVEGSFQTSQMIQIIDILTYMGHKTEKQASFKHIIEILEQCILCYDFDKQTIAATTEPALKSTASTAAEPKQSIARKEIITQLSQDQLKMKIFQQHALNRLIQLFIIKGKCLDETDKAVYVYNVLLKILKVSANDRKAVICNELLDQLKVNTYRELCWQDMDDPLVIEIFTRQYSSSQPIDDAARQSSDSQGNSSGSDSQPTGHNLGRAVGASSYQETSNAANNRSSLDKLGQDKQIIQNTLKTLLNCFEDMQTAIDIRQHCLKLFHYFMAFISDEDFSNFEYSAIGGRQPIVVDNKADWVKMVNTLIKNYDPLKEPDFALLIIDIFYTIIGLESYYKLLSQPLLIAITEELLETLFLISNHLHKSKRGELFDSNMQSMQQLQASHKSKQKDKDLKRQFGSFSGDPSLMFGQGELEDPGANKNLIKVAKKVISLLGFIFSIDGCYGSAFLSQPAKECLPYVIPPQGQDFLTGGQNLASSSRLQRPDQEVKLIEYLIDQLLAITLNNQIVFKISHHILICVSNIINFIKNDSSILSSYPYLLDSLIFLNIRIVLPFMLNITELADPVYRAKQLAHKMNKSLKDLFRMHYSQFKIEDKFYIKSLTHHTENDNMERHLILDNLSKLLQMKGVADESTVQPILILFFQYETDVQSNISVLESQSRGRSKDIVRQETKLRQYLECIAQNVLWISHSVYDRNCNISIDELSTVQSSNAICHYMWNKNILTVKQWGNKYDIIVRNASYNYRVEVTTQNKLLQTSIGNANQISKMRNLLMRQAKGRSLENIFDSQQVEKIDIQKLVLNDATLMALIDPSSSYMFKKSKELLYFPDEQQFRSHLRTLDTISPKNLYCLAVTYVPRHITTDLKSLYDIQIGGPEFISENHLHFLSMLGSVLQINGGYESIKSLNCSLYLKQAMLDKFKDQSVNLIINEDESNFIYYVSNVLNEKREINESFTQQQAFSRDKIHIIYNESNIQDFSHFDQQKIFIVISKLNELHYQLEIQHSRTPQNIAKFDGFQDNNASLGLPQTAQQLVQDLNNVAQSTQLTEEPTPLPTQRSLSSQQSSFTFDELNRDGSTVNNAGSSNQQQRKTKLYKNGHLCRSAIISQDKIGEWIKQISILSDIFDKNQRFRNKDYITSTIMQRHACIKDFKTKFSKYGKPITMLK